MLRWFSESMSPSSPMEGRMVSKESAVKKYIVILSDAEREQLTALIHSGKHPAQKLLKARILLKADASEGGEAGSTARLRRRCRPVSIRLPGRANGWSKRGWRLP